MAQGVLNAVIAARLLRYHLVRFREQAGVSQVQAAQRIDRKQPTIASMETGKSLPTQSNIEVLLNFYGFPEQFPMLRDLLTVAKLRQETQNVVPSVVIRDFSLAVGLEPYARKIDAFEPSVVYGLLQTEAYTRTLMEYVASIRPGVDVEGEVAIRMKRQEAVSRDVDPVELWVFTEEAVFRRLVGGPGVMSDQLDHLLRMSERPNVNLLIIPESVAVHPALQGAFYLLGFEDGWRIAYEETQRTTYYYDASDAVDAYSQCVDHLRYLALSPARSQGLLNRRKKEITSG